MSCLQTPIKKDKIYWASVMMVSDRSTYQRDSKNFTLCLEMQFITINFLEMSVGTRMKQGWVWFFFFRF